MIFCKEHLIIFVIITSIRVVICYKSAEIDVVEKVILLQNDPKEVVALLCWNRENILNSLKYLSGNNISVAVYNRNIHLPEHSHSILFVLDMSCKFSDSILEQANERNLYKPPFRWFLFGDNSFEHYTKILFRYNIDLDSYLLIATKSNYESYAINTIYKLEDFSKFFIAYVGNYTNGSITFMHIKIHQYRQNLYGTTVRTSLVFGNNDSFNHLWDYRDSHIDTISKLNYIFIWHLYNMLNATRQFSRQYTYGYRSNTSIYYTGMVGDLQNRTADIGGSAMFVTADRIPVVDYIAPTTKTFARFIFRAPPLSYVSNIFTLPFNRAVWISSMLLVVIFMISLGVILRWESNDTHFTKAPKANASDVSLMGVGAVFQQGTEFVPQSGAGKTCLFLMLLSMMFICTSYSANIVALLQSTTTSINSIGKLLESRLSIGVHNAPWSFHYFKAEQEPVKKAFYEKKVAPGGKLTNFIPMEKGIAYVRKGFFAFHVETGPAYKLVSETFEENEKCGLQEIEFWNLISPWLAIQKNSTYKEILKIGLRKIHESGIRNREIDRLYAKKPKCENAGHNFISVDLLDCYAAFLVFGAGCAFAFVLLIFESLYNKYFVRYCRNGNNFNGEQLNIDFSN